jgi:hypothetical protein
MRIRFRRILVKSMAARFHFLDLPLALALRSKDLYPGYSRMTLQNE